MTKYNHVNGRSANYLSVTFTFLSFHPCHFYEGRFYLFISPGYLGLLLVFTGCEANNVGDQAAYRNVYKPFFILSITRV